MEDSVVSKCRLTARCSGGNRKGIWSSLTNAEDQINYCDYYCNIWVWWHGNLRSNLCSSKTFGEIHFSVRLTIPFLTSVTIWSHLSYLRGHWWDLDVYSDQGWVKKEQDLWPGGKTDAPWGDVGGRSCQQQSLLWLGKRTCCLIANRLGHHFYRSREVPATENILYSWRQGAWLRVQVLESNCLSSYPDPIKFWWYNLEQVIKYH